MICKLCRTDTQIFLQYVQLKLQNQRVPSTKHPTLSQLHQGHMHYLYDTLRTAQLVTACGNAEETYGLWFLPVACLTTVGLTKAS